jgi:hypothetical protein
MLEVLGNTDPTALTPCSSSSSSFVLVLDPNAKERRMRNEMANVGEEENNSVRGLERRTRTTYGCSGVTTR